MGPSDLGYGCKHEMDSNKLNNCLQIEQHTHKKKMIGEVAAVPRSLWVHPHTKIRSPTSISVSIPTNRTHLEKIKNPARKLSTTIASPLFSVKAAAASASVEYAEEPATSVKFPTSLDLPGCSTALSLIGTGFREKVFAIIGVKVYAAGLYLNPDILDTLDAWKGRKAAQIEQDSSLFDSIYQAPLEKSLQIVLVRDIDGKTFWDALDEAVSPRIKSPNSTDRNALSAFRAIFQDRPLKKGTFIFLTWVDPSKMLVHISTDGNPSAAEATIESENVTSSLFDVFFGRAPVSPTLKSSISNSLASFLK
ncbi:putative chalcone isomerase [Helianthus annuus]|uniref:Chalcone-flavonone isomerase family protein n=1 Tax=Helianthus annuus TaxID=4232 RepID=A0A251SDD4_HELAN|nr:fatty-acid-binding protein 3, chloroplastic [Helianthus annuus]KAF5766530.1 putative chalcone isomerase [Helianthus annuus]KAJ0452890.1 putative chalcone isomerase [Helianthus annuus]KAJ0474805.1 putative chalcone isomerase [Helianthus annuus]KAJ0650360.1 putative chalcone isomerase [Helianthus annuus]KAJ0654129.1 putative chalcone isomerase [Helianthus annuus]